MKNIIFTILVVLFFTTNTKAQYCTPSSTASASNFYTHFLRFSFGDLDQKYAAPWSTANPFYYNYSYLSTTIVRGYTYPLTIILGNGGNTQTAAVWIDYNQNQIFETSEKLYTKTDNANVGDHTLRTSITIPANAALGSTRIRIGTLIGTVAPDPCVNNLQNSMAFNDYTLTIVDANVQKFQSSNTYQDILDEVTAGSADNQILKITINTNPDGTLSPLTVDSFYLTLLGTTNPAEITNAKLFYTGKNPEFLTTNQIGSTISKPGTKFTIATNQKLAPGMNYFWLTYDISSAAIIGNLVDARCNGVFVITRRFPSTIDPSGTRRIGYCISKGNKSVFVYTRKVTLGTINNGIQYYNDPGYSDYTYLSTNLFKSGFHHLSVEVGNGVNTEFVRAWIDFNRDGIFDNNTELVLHDSIMVASATIPNYGPVSDSFEIPLNAPVGPTRMRVSTHYNPTTAPFRTPAYPCENPLEVGEVEDYTIVIADSGQTVADFKFNIACIGFPTTFSDVSYTFGTQYKVNSWVWDFGDGDTSHSQNPKHTYKKAGVYSVKLTAKTNYAGAIIGTITKAVRVNDPVADFSVNGSLWQTQINFLDETTGGIATTWYWDFDDPGSGYDNYSNKKTPYHIYSSVGKYNVTFIVTTDGGCKDTIKKTITIDSIIAPVPDFSAATFNPYVNQQVSFQDLSVYFPTSWKWIVSPNTIKYYQGTSSSSQNPVISFNNTGLYSVKLVVTNGKGSDSITKMVTVKNYLVPTADFSANPVTVKAGQVVSFLDKSTNDPNTWKWQFGDNDSSNVQYPTHVYPSIGNYTISLEASNPAGSDKEIKTNYIKVTNEYDMCDNDAPLSKLFTGYIFDSGGKNANYKSNSSCGFLINPDCAGTITLTFQLFDMDLTDYITVYDGKDNTGIKLFTGNGFTGNIKPPVLVAKSGAMYIEEYTDNGTVRPGFAAYWNAVSNVKPKPVIKADTVGYANSPITFFNKTILGAGNKYAWDYNNDGVFEDSTSFDGSYRFNTNGTYTLALKATNCSGMGITYHTIRIIKATKIPVASFISDEDTVSEGQKVKFYDMSSNGPTLWKWEIKTKDYFQAYFFADGTTDTSQNPIIEFYGIGTFDISLTASNQIGKSPTITEKNYIVTIAQASMGSWPFENASPAGRLYDGGGAGGDYSNNENFSLLLNPCATKIYLRFSKFDFAASDYIRVYDGKDNTGRALHPGNGFTTGALPSFTKPLEAASGYMYIEEITSFSGVASGFVADWWIDPIPEPVASFTASDTAYVNGAITSFLNTSKGLIDKVYWDFDYDGLVDDSTYHGTYAYTIPKHQYVYMSVFNCAGENVAVREFEVVNQKQKPKTDFNADRISADTSDVITLHDLSKYGPANWTWYFSTPNVSFLNPQGNNYPIPEIKFSTPGKYDVGLVSKNTFGFDSIYKVEYLNIFAYCRPAIDNLLPNFGISRVVVNDIDNSSKAGTTVYTDYTASKSTTLELGGTYNYSIYGNTTAYPYSRKIWIDYNQDGTFTEPAELVVNVSNVTTLLSEGTFKVPASATLGTTRMRVGVNYAGYTNNPCGKNNFGEFEDYRIYISEDKTPPVITLKGNNPALTELSYVYIDSGAYAIDAVEGDISSSIVITSNVDINKTGKYEVKYNVQDTKGNKSTEVKRTVFVTPDKTKPVITLKGNNPMTLAVFWPYKEPGAFATDNMDGDVSANLIIQRNVDSSRVDSYFVYYTAYDNTGNFSDQISRKVLVIDTVAPVIALLGSDTLDVPVGGTLTDPGTIVTDNYYSGLITTKTQNVNINKDGWYWIRYDVTDPSGNPAKYVKRVVKVGNPISVEEIFADNSFNIFPNPSHGSFTITMELFTEQDVSISVINSLGKEIKNIHLNNILSADIPVDLVNQSQGVYFVKIHLKNGIVTRKVTIVN